MIALVVIATGQAYWQFINPLIRSAHKFFFPDGLVHILLFTDRYKKFEVARQLHIDDEGFPRTTLLRYGTILGEREWLAKHEHIFYIDVDAVFVDRVGEEILSEGITVTQHAGYVGNAGPYERRPESSARTAGCGHYCAGGFLGGTSAAFLEMARDIHEKVELDNARHITAVYHDESHLQRYLADHPPAKVLSPSYCFPPPETQQAYRKQVWGGKKYEPKIVVLTKQWKAAA